jgi:hypothetical protein
MAEEGAYIRNPQPGQGFCGSRAGAFNVID